jgi:hypothetical protein
VRLQNVLKNGSDVITIDAFLPIVIIKLIFMHNFFLISIQHFFPEGRCDGGIDCINGEDENNCDNYQQSLSETNSTSSHVSLTVSTPPTVPSNKTILKSSPTMLEPPTSSATSAHSRG